MAQDTTYNGWTNYATWSVALFIDNESNECIQDAARAALVDDYGDALKTYVEEYFLTDPETGDYLGGMNLFVQQLIGAAMSAVNWRELHGHYLETAREYGMLDEETEEEQPEE
jgi:hypothetical protein